MLGFREVNVEEEIKKIIFDTRCHFRNLTVERTCRIYSSFVYEKLRDKGIIARLIDTNDFCDDYSHMFVLVPYVDNKYYLIDLTYSQFLENGCGILELISDGYVLLDDELWKRYLEDVFVISNVKHDDAFYGIKR